MSLSDLLSAVPDQPDLRAQASGGIPPQILVFDGLQRSRSRSLDPDEAVAHAERGRPAYLFTFGKCVQLSPELLGQVFMDDDFVSSAHVDEGTILMYGRQRPGRPDTRIVVVSLAAWVD